MTMQFEAARSSEYVSRSAAARQSAQPAERQERTELELSTEILKRQSALRSFMALISATVVAFLAIGGIFVWLGNAYAFESHRSQAVNRRSMQVNDQMKYWSSQKTATVTPTTIGQKAANVGMIRAEEKDEITLH